jgi:hypothetical protein
VTRSSGVGLAALAVLGIGCGRQELDLLVKAQREDPCLGFVTQSACDANAALGCSFQPNAEGCQSTDPNCLPGMCRGGDPFVRRVERSFFLNGDPFRFVGVSSWALLDLNKCTMIKPEDRAAWTESAYDQLVPSRSKVARLFAFQSSLGPAGNDFTLFDASVADARRAGIRLQLVLEHGEGGCSEGGHRDAAWYAGGYQSPDAGYALSYRDYSEALARRYRDEPTVLGYVLMQGLGGADTTALSSFVTDIGQLLHGVAPSQLVSLDLKWDPTNDEGGTSYRALQDLPVVDLVDLDDYSFEQTLQPLDPILLNTLAEIDKPAVVGEGAFLLDGTSDAALAQRAQKARERTAQWRQWGLSGALFWAYQPGWAITSEEFDAREADPILQPGGVIASAPW